MASPRIGPSMTLSLPYRIALIFLLWIAGMTAAAQFAKISVPFELIKAVYPEQGDAVGWLLTLVSVMGAFLGMTSGTFVARLGLERVLAFGLLVGGAMSLLQSGLPGFELMMATRLLEGISHLTIVISAPTLIAQIATDKIRGASMALWSTFFGGSFAIVAWLGAPFVFEHGLGALFQVHGGLMIALALVIWLLRSVLQAFVPAHSGVLTAKEFVAQHVRALTKISILIPSLGWLFYTLTFVSLMTILPEQFADHLRVRVVGIMPLGSIAVSLIVVTALLAIMSASLATMTGFAASMAALMLYFTGLPIETVAIVLFAALGIVQGASFAVVPALNESAEDRTLANGFMAQMGNMGNLLGTPVLLAVMGLGGLDYVFGAILVIYALGITAHAFALRRA